MFTALFALLFLLVACVDVDLHAALEPSPSFRDVTLGINWNFVHAHNGFTSTIADSFCALKPNAYRYPGGTIANYWNSTTGWFISNAHYASLNFNGATKVPHGYGGIAGTAGASATMDNVQAVLMARCNVRIIFVVNMLTGTLAEARAAVIDWRDRLGVVPAAIELGNEFYLDADDYGLRFPTATAYATEALAWHTSLASLLPASTRFVYVGVDGGTTPRISTWNAQVSAVLAAAPAAARAAATISMHTYFGTGIPVSGTKTGFWGTLAQQQQVWQELSAGSTTTLDRVATLGVAHQKNVMQQVAPAVPSDVSVTEFNLFDRTGVVRHSWLHALQVVGSLSYLARHATHVVLHALHGAAFGATFTVTGTFSGLLVGPESASSLDACVQQHTPTSTGLAFRTIGEALDFCIGAGDSDMVYVDFVEALPSPIQIIGTSVSRISGVVFRSRAAVESVPASAEVAGPLGDVRAGAVLINYDEAPVVVRLAALLANLSAHAPRPATAVPLNVTVYTPTKAVIRHICDVTSHVVSTQVGRADSFTLPPRSFARLTVGWDAFDETATTQSDANRVATTASDATTTTTTTTTTTRSNAAVGAPSVMDAEKEETSSVAVAIGVGVGVCVILLCAGLGLLVVLSSLRSKERSGSGRRRSRSRSVSSQHLRRSAPTPLSRSFADSRRLSTPFY